jgi:hypothetical protein
MPHSVVAPALVRHGLIASIPTVAAALTGAHPRASGAPAWLRDRLRAQFEAPPGPVLGRPRSRRAGEGADEYERYLRDLGYGLAVDHIRRIGVPWSALFLELRSPDGEGPPPAGPDGRAAGEAEGPPNVAIPGRPHPM